MTSEKSEVKVKKKRRSVATESEKRDEIARILKSLKVNPLVILQLDPFTWSGKEINKNYKRISLLIHPDKVPSEMRIDATRAFGKLSEAKKMLSEEKSENAMRFKVIEATRRVQHRKLDAFEKEIVQWRANQVERSRLEQKKKNDDPFSISIGMKRSLRESRSTDTGGDANGEKDGETNGKRGHLSMPLLKKRRLARTSKKENENGTENGNENENEIDEKKENGCENAIGDEWIDLKESEARTGDIRTLIDLAEIDVSPEEVINELDEIFIDDAWQKRIETKVQQKKDAQVNAYREELRTEIKARKKRAEKWNESRNERVDSWKDFMKSKKGKKKSKKKKKKLKQKN